MTRDQRIVAVGAAAGIAAMALALWLLSTRLPPPAGVATLADRLAFAARWLAFAALPLLAMVAAVGNARFLGEAIDPTLGAEDKAMIVNGRVADNTAQQFLLFMAGALGLAASLPAAQMGVIRAAAIVFVAARFVFWIGYRLHPLCRAPGFAATAYLNLGLLLAAVSLAVA
ncbi:MAG TPA: MAPEG family protein [Allosphingosinicella sp.]|nr:MAPEG family protein [Allosphingosinicella sp.]